MTRLSLAATIHLARVSSMVDTVLARPLASDHDLHGDLLLRHVERRDALAGSLLQVLSELRRVVGDKLRAIAHPADRDEEGALRRQVPLQ